MIRRTEMAIPIGGYSGSGMFPKENKGIADETGDDSMLMAKRRKAFNGLQGLARVGSAFFLSPGIRLTLIFGTLKCCSSMHTAGRLSGKICGE